MGLSDECEELTTLRAFRDGYMMALPDGQKMISEYYTRAPAIVGAINRSEDVVMAATWENMYQTIKACVKAIQNRNYEYALQTYVTAVRNLEEEFLGVVATGGNDKLYN
jgi:hypothetical protein